MDEKFDKAIDNVLAMVRSNCKPEDAMKFTQSALNLAHAKETLRASNLAYIGNTETRQPKKSGVGAS
jgi:hypothetical protein